MQKFEPSKKLRFEKINDASFCYESPKYLCLMLIQGKYNTIF